MTWRIIRGYYLTALGQESERYYFKTTNQNIQTGDVGVTFYQNSQMITAIPALIRVDKIIETEQSDDHFLTEEKENHLPLLPLVRTYDHFKPDAQIELETAYQTLRKEMQSLSKLEYVQSSIFDFLEENNT